MANELIKEKIALSRVVGKETAQLLLESDIIVPDIKPDMAVMLKADADIVFDRVDILNDRISYFGKLTIKALYLSKGDNNVHSVSVSTNVEDFINMDGVSKDMWASVNAIISNIDYKLVNDRKIGYRAVIEVSATVEERTESLVVTGIENLPEAQLKMGKLNVNRTVEHKEDRFIIKEDLNVTSGKPNIREILHTNISISNKETRVSAGKVNISGELIVSILYRTDDTENVLEFIEHEVPFNGAIDAAAAADGMVCDAALRLLDQYIQARPNEDGEDRVIEMEASIGVMMKITTQSEVNVLEDAYCIDKTLEYTKQAVSFPALICRNKNQHTVKEVVRLDDSNPEILQIFRVSGRVQHDDTTIADDRITVEGVIYTDILYIAGSDDSPLYNHKSILPFKQTIETKGAQTGMDVNLEINIDHSSFSMLSEKEVEIRFLLSCNANVTENIHSEVITDIEFNDTDKSILDKMAAMTICIVQPGDTLWSIAKRYNAALDDLIALNDLEDPNKIYPGQKIVIVKRGLGL